MECKLYIEYEDIAEIKEIFIHGLKHNKTDKVGSFILSGCESDELYESDKLCNFWSNKIINKEIEKKDFKITGWSFMALVKSNIF